MFHNTVNLSHDISLLELFAGQHITISAVDVVMQPCWRGHNKQVIEVNNVGHDEQMRLACESYCQFMQMLTYAC